MLKQIAVRQAQGWQYVLDPRKAAPLGFRGRPEILAKPCEEACRACQDACPTGAIALAPVRIDLGVCIFCGDCAPVCPVQKIGFTADYRMAATTREGLVLGEGKRELDPVRVKEELARVFGGSLKLRQVSAGGCNGCELELNASANVNFDVGRYGIEWVASPRHADALVLSGPISANMAAALQLCWDGIPEPKFVIATGACAISGAPFQEAAAVDRAFLERFVPALYVPGCPPHPLTFVCGILDLLGIES